MIRTPLGNIHKKSDLSTIKSNRITLTSLKQKLDSNR